MNSLLSIAMAFLFFLAPKPETINDAIDQIISSFSEGNVEKLSQFFGGSVEIATPTGEGVYSKAQAKQVIARFFSQNKGANSQLIHNGTSSSGSKFIVLHYKSNQEEFRITIFLKQSGSDFLIQEIDIVKQL
jgi:hypothetical protein